MAYDELQTLKAA